MNWSTIAPEGDDLKICYLVRVRSGEFFTIINKPDYRLGNTPCWCEKGADEYAGDYEVHAGDITHWLKIEPPANVIYENWPFRKNDECPDPNCDGKFYEPSVHDPGCSCHGRIAEYLCGHLLICNKCGWR